MNNTASLSIVSHRSELARGPRPSPPAQPLFLLLLHRVNLLLQCGQVVAHPMRGCLQGLYWYAKEGQRSCSESGTPGSARQATSVVQSEGGVCSILCEVWVWEGMRIGIKNAHRCRPGAARLTPCSLAGRSSKFRSRRGSHRPGNQTVCCICVSAYDPVIIACNTMLWFD